MNKSIIPKINIFPDMEAVEKLTVSDWQNAILNMSLYIFFVLGTVAYVTSLYLIFTITSQWLAAGVYTFFYIWLCVVTFVKRIPYVYRAGIFIASIFSVGTFLMYKDGLVGGGRVWLLTLSVIVTSLFGFRKGIVFLVINTAVMWGFYLLAVSGRLQYEGQPNDVWLITTITFTLMSVLLVFSTGPFFDFFEKALSKQLDIASDLEKQVESRVRDLSALIAVSNKLVTILDEQTLVSEVVNQIQSAFHYYHVHIYTLDEACEYLVMAGGTGKAGLTMLAQGHKIPFGKGLVGRAAKNNQPVLVSDVSQDPNWLPNPLLPETRAETAVPISLENEVLGVLDVQHNVVNGLTEEDVSLLQSVANQVAVALRNAHLYEDVRQKALQESRLNEIGHEIQQAVNIEKVLETAVRELGKTLKTPKVAVVLDQQTLRSYDKN